LIKELNLSKFLCQSRLHNASHAKQQVYTHFFSWRVLNPFITGHEPRKLFAISLTAEQISQSASFQVSASSNEEWFHWPQIEIQPTTGAIVE
jgi:hypothetical protein